MIAIEKHARRVEVVESKELARPDSARDAIAAASGRALVRVCGARTDDVTGSISSGRTAAHRGRSEQRRSESLQRHPGCASPTATE